MTVTPAPKRVFDPMMPRTGQYRPIADTEDQTFSDWLQRQLDEILSLSETPPRCPHCQSDGAVLFARAAHPKPILPVFRCLSCDVHFRRTTGTPYLMGQKGRRFELRLSVGGERLSALGPIEIKQATDKVIRSCVSDSTFTEASPREVQDRLRDALCSR